VAYRIRKILVAANIRFGFTLKPSTSKSNTFAYARMAHVMPLLTLKELKQSLQDPKDACYGDFESTRPSYNCSTNRDRRNNSHREHGRCKKAGIAQIEGIQEMIKFAQTVESKQNE
jgi:hypothetical protein